MSNFVSDITCKTKVHSPTLSESRESFPTALPDDIDIIVPEVVDAVGCVGADHTLTLAESAEEDWENDVTDAAVPALGYRIVERVETNGNASHLRSIPVWMNDVSEMVGNGGSAGGRAWHSGSLEGVVALRIATTRVRRVCEYLQGIGVRWYAPHILVHMPRGTGAYQRQMFPGYVFMEPGLTARVKIGSGSGTTWMERSAAMDVVGEDLWPTYGQQQLMKLLSQLHWRRQWVVPKSAAGMARFANELLTLSKLLSVDPFVQPRRGIWPGKRVVVREGVLAGCEGTVVTEPVGAFKDGRERKRWEAHMSSPWTTLQVTVGLFGRAVPIYIERNSLELL